MIHSSTSLRLRRTVVINPSSSLVAASAASAVGDFRSAASPAQGSLSRGFLRLAPDPHHHITLHCFVRPLSGLASRVQRLCLSAYSPAKLCIISPHLATHRNLPIEPALSKERTACGRCIANAANLILNTPNRPLSVPEFDTSAPPVDGIETRTVRSRLLPVPDTEFAGVDPWSHAGGLSSPLGSPIRVSRLLIPLSSVYIQVSRPAPIGDKRSPPPLVG